MPVVKTKNALAVRALPSVHSPPEPFNVIFDTAEKLVPLVVIVLPVVVALNVILPEAFQTVPATKDIDPLIASVPLLVNVTVPADTVKSRQVKAPVNVTV